MRAIALRPRTLLWMVLLGLAAALGGGGQASAQTAAQCAAAWERARENYSATEIQAFIKAYAKCPEVAEARQALAVLRSPSMGGEHPDAARFSPVGRILPRGTPFVAEGGGYGVVLLRPAVGDRNRQACEVMRRALTFEVAAVDKTPELIDGFYVYRRPIYWPIAGAPVTTGDWTCDAMLRNYDYERAWLHFTPPADFPRLSQPGPYIVLVRESGEQAAVFDFSRVPADEFDRQFDAVLRYMSRDSSIWDNTYYVASSFRQRMRKLLSEDNHEVTLVLASLVGLPKPIKAGAADQ